MIWEILFDLLVFTLLGETTEAIERRLLRLIGRPEPARNTRLLISFLSAMLAAVGFAAMVLGLIWLAARVAAM